MDSTDPAYPRYVMLADALGGENQLGGHGRAVVARLAAWSGSEDTGTLSALIDARVTARVTRCRGLLARVAHAFDQAERTEGGNYLLTIGPTLARDLLNEGAQR